MAHTEGIVLDGIDILLLGEKRPISQLLPPRLFTFTKLSCQNIPRYYPHHGSILCLNAKNEWRVISASQTQVLPTLQPLSPRQKQSDCMVRKKVTCMMLQN